MKSLVADLLVTYETVDRPEATPINPNDKTLSLSITDSLYSKYYRLWNSLPIECCPVTYDLNGYNSIIN